MTLRIVTLAVLSVLLAGCGRQSVASIAAETTKDGNSDWQLVWSDDFDGDSLDRSKWEPEESCWGGGNNERQCYTDRSDNIKIKDGILSLIAKPEIFTGLKYPQDWAHRGELVTQPYTSGKLRTKGLASWQYGRFEARMKLPKGQSTWSAFWMMSEHDYYGLWPRSGEIDIMESVNLGAICDDCGDDGVENRISGALHFGKDWPENEFHTQEVELSSDVIPSESFHIFSIEWQKDKIDWFVDGERYVSLNATDWSTATVSKEDNAYAPFDQPFYVMLNLAVGGNLPDGRNEQQFNPYSFPAELLVDWVRVYTQEKSQ